MVKPPGRGGRGATRILRDLGEQLLAIGRARPSPPNARCEIEKSHQGRALAVADQVVQEHARIERREGARALVRAGAPSKGRLLVLHE